METTITKKNGKYITLALLVGFTYRILLSLQGIDHTDLGFSNTFYQNIFTHPEAVTLHFNYYLTGLVGGLWYQLLPATGVLGFRLLEAITLTAAIYFTYKTFQRQLYNTRVAILAILLSFLFPFLVTTFHYNTLTFLFMAISAWCYSKSLYSKQALWTFLTGVTIGLCFFVRIANITLLLLILVPVVYALATRQKTLARKLGGIMFIGMLCGTILVIGIMILLGHLPYFLSGLHDNIARVDEGIWTLSGILALSYFRDLVNIILQILAIIGLGALYLQSSRISSRWADVLRMILIITSLVLIATSLPYLSSMSLYTLLCAPIFYSITPKEDKLQAAFVILAAYLYPMGNDSGIVNIYHWTAALLIIPAVVGTYHTSYILRKGVFIYSLYIAAVMLWRAALYPYGESTPRWQCTEKVQASLLNTYTTPEKAHDYRHIITAIQGKTDNTPWLLIGNQASELYYATGKLPYLGQTQQKAYKGHKLYERLQYQHNRYQQLPVVVILKKEHFLSDDDEEVQNTLRQWMDDHDYHIVTDDDNLTIHQPTTR